MNFFLFAIYMVVAVVSEAGTLTIFEATRHLGVAGKPEWEHFQGKEPEGESLTLNFAAGANTREHTLFIRQKDVKQEWNVTLNDKKIGQLFLMESDVTHAITLPAGSLRDGENRIVISTRAPEDILIHRIWVGDDSKEKLLSAGPVIFRIEDAKTGSQIPGRLTIVDSNGSLAPIFDYGDTNLATRPGVVYTGTGSARVKLLPGKYQVYATRGPEYSMASREFLAEAGKNITLSIERQADTRGWVSSDTHVHTFTLSKHGDATLRERVITLAGENVEMPVTTEHNLNADYRETARNVGLQKFFTLVAGNEVTTRKGHFNIFPVEPGGKPPNANTEIWTELFQGIKQTPRVQVITLNHPTDNHSGFVPLAMTNINVLTGRYARDGFPFEFTAMELINSGAMRSSWTEPLRVWFALLNRGHRVVAVGASDSHDVSRFIVGQGRTYIRSDDADVSGIDIAKACENLNKGRAVVSLGLIARMTISQESAAPGAATTGRAEPGESLAAATGELFADIVIDAPLVPDKAPYIAIVANGVPVFESWASPRINRITLKRPAHDTYFVLLAEIGGNPAPYWELARPYQPSSKKIKPALLGVTNPIWVDADGDGKFTSARGYAETLRAKYADPNRFLSALMRYDSAVVWQGADLLNLTRESAEFATAQGPLRNRLDEYLQAQEMLGSP